MPCVQRFSRVNTRKVLQMFIQFIQFWELLGWFKALGRCYLNMGRLWNREFCALGAWLCSTDCWLSRVKNKILYRSMDMTSRKHMDQDRICTNWEYAYEIYKYDILRSQVDDPNILCAIILQCVVHFLVACNVYKSKTYFWESKLAQQQYPSSLVAWKKTISCGELTFEKHWWTVSLEHLEWFWNHAAKLLGWWRVRVS